jgi:hypothetical protein
MPRTTPQAPAPPPATELTFALWPPAARRALALPSRRTPGASWWDDICEVLLNPDADRRTAESVHRWLHDQLRGELAAMLGRGNPCSLVVWACRLAPRMIWKLPCSFAVPPPRTHRLIIAILLPHKLRLLTDELARIALVWRLRRDFQSAAP